MLELEAGGKHDVLEETPGLRPLSSGLAPSLTAVCSNMAMRFRTLILAVVRGGMSCGVLCVVCSGGKERVGCREDPRD